jgi:hypothetical protein
MKFICFQSVIFLYSVVFNNFIHFNYLLKIKRGYEVGKTIVDIPTP